ncbi:MAG: MBL fold metallo-hydrolase [Ignavibacteriaceae bacterium]
MNNSIIKFIGTGSGKTSLKRYHSAFLISHKGYTLLVDAGDGISKAILSQKIPFSSINGILLTHLHPDHYTGLASLIVQMKLTGRNNSLQIIVHKKLKKVIENYLLSSYLLKERMNFKLFIETFDHNKSFKLNDSFSFIGKQNSHLNKYKEYSSANELNFLSSSILFGIDEKHIFYTGDVGKKEDLYLFKSHKSDIIISEVTHVSIEDLLEALTHLKPEKLYLNHISDETEHFLAQKKSFLKQHNITAVVDGFTIKI